MFDRIIGSAHESRTLTKIFAFLLPQLRPGEIRLAEAKKAEKAMEALI